MSALTEAVEDIDAKIEFVRSKIRSASIEDPLLANNWVGASMSLDAFQRKVDDATGMAIALDNSIRRCKAQG